MLQICLQYHSPGFQARSFDLSAGSLYNLIMLMVLGSDKQQTVPDSAVSHFLYVSPQRKTQHFPAGCSFLTWIVPSNKKGERGSYMKTKINTIIFDLKVITLMHLQTKNQDSHN